MDALNEGKLDLNVSPIINYKKDLYILLFLDIESIIKPSKLGINNLYYAFSGRGIHVYIPYFTEYKEFTRYREEIVTLFKNTDIDIVTTLKITPFRFMGAYSTKHDVWLHPMTVKDDIKYAINNAKTKPFDLMPKEDYYNKIISFFDKLKYMNTKDFVNLYYKIRKAI
ncbi:MAG: hypothetical protein F9Y92_06150 [Thermoplasmatales archaeon]|nr:hypothetical protein [Thermoplasmatales archaeon]